MFGLKISHTIFNKIANLDDCLLSAKLSPAPANLPIKLKKLFDNLKKLRYNIMDPDSNLDINKLSKKTQSLIRRLKYTKECLKNYSNWNWSSFFYLPPSNSDDLSNVNDCINSYLNDNDNIDLDGSIPESNNNKKNKRKVDSEIQTEIIIRKKRKKKNKIENDHDKDIDFENEVEQNKQNKDQKKRKKSKNLYIINNCKYFKKSEDQPTKRLILILNKSQRQLLKFNSSLLPKDVGGKFVYAPLKNNTICTNCKTLNKIEDEKCSVCDQSNTEII